MKPNPLICLILICAFSSLILLPPHVQSEPKNAPFSTQPAIGGLCVVAAICVVGLVIIAVTDITTQAAVQKERNWLEFLSHQTDRGQPVNLSGMQCKAGVTITIDAEGSTPDGRASGSMTIGCGCLSLNEKEKCINPISGPGLDLTTLGTTDSRVTYRNIDTRSIVRLDLTANVDTLKFQIGQADVAPGPGHYGRSTFHLRSGVAFADSITNPNQMIQVFDSSVEMMYDQRGPTFNVTGDLAGHFIGPTIESAENGALAYTFKILSEDLTKSYFPAVPVAPGQPFVLWTETTTTTQAEAPSPTGVWGTPVSTLRASPNPFRTSLVFELPPDSPAHGLTVFDLQGKEIVEIPLKTGTDVINWDGRDETGRLIPPGVYFAKLTDEGPAVRIVRLM